MPWTPLPEAINKLTESQHTQPTIDRQPLEYHYHYRGEEKHPTAPSWMGRVHMFIDRTPTYQERTDTIQMLTRSYRRVVEFPCTTPSCLLQPVFNKDIGKAIKQQVNSHHEPIEP